MTPTATPSRASRPSTPPRAALRVQVALLAGPHPRAGQLLELRFRLPAGGMAARFYPADRPGGLIEAALRVGARRDAYLGCVPRARRAGGRDDLTASWVAWADCDHPAAAQALAELPAPPTLVIASGSPGARHAYWALRTPTGPDRLERLNRALARALDADQACADAARILRPAGTHNFKHRPARPVELLAHHPQRRYHVDELLATLPDPPASDPPAPPPPAAPRPAAAGDPLLELAPTAYVGALLGRQVGRDGKTRCPFHEDRTPSLHCYPTPQQGWFCFSCRRGGSIYDLACALWSLDTHGREFLQLRDRLHRQILAGRRRGR